MKRFWNLSLQKKIFVICITVSLIPLCGLGILFTANARTTMISRERQVLEDALHQQIDILDTTIDNYSLAEKYICYNNSLRVALLETYTTNSKMMKMYDDVLTPLVGTINSLYYGGGIVSNTLYTDLGIYPRMHRLAPLSDIENNSWYSDACNTINPVLMYQKVDGKDTLFFYCSVYDTGNTTGVLKMDLDYNQFFSSLRKLYDDHYGILVTAEDGTVIYSYETADMVKYHTSEMESISNSRKLIVELDNISDVNWQVSLYRPVNIVYSSVYRFYLLLSITLVFCIVSMLVLGISLSRDVVEPLRKLRLSMEKMEGGQYEKAFIPRGNDEVGVLVNTFNNMVEKINHLVNEILNVRIREQDLELKALQAQINPHFLYNALSMINSRAIMIKSPDIAQMAQYMSTFYRNTLNKGNAVISVSDEIAGIKAYINIQLLFHSNSFRVEYRLQDEIFELHTVKLILQPVVENAILHGLDQCLRKDKLLRISGAVENGKLVFHVRDNGTGMSQEQIIRILTEASDGYGICNVEKRIKLLYGDEYGLIYQSILGDGTDVTITLPTEID